jgi:hypothetical protein
MKVFKTLPLVLLLLLIASCSSSGESSDSSQPNPDQSSALQGRIGISGITQNYEGSTESWKQLLEEANAIGAERLHLQAPRWSEAEASPGSFDLSYFDPFIQLIGEFQLAYSVDIATPLGLGSVDLPTDLVFSSFTDPVLIERYLQFVEAVLDKLNGASHVILHTETAGPFFNNDPNSSDFQDFCDLISITAKHVRTVRPGLKVGIYGTKDESPELLSCLNRSTDFFGIGYIADRGDAPHQAILSRLVSQSSGKPVVLFEAGIPTSTLLGGSEDAQTAFVNLIFDFAAEQGDNLLFFSFYQMFDESIEVTSQYVPLLFSNFLTERARGINRLF